MSDLPIPDAIGAIVDQIRSELDAAIKHAEAAVGPVEANRIYEQRSERRCQVYRHLSVEQRLGYYRSLFEHMERRRV